MVYQVYYGITLIEIVLIDLTQDPVRGRWANLKKQKTNYSPFKKRNE
jgi:hypothetical protein